MNDRKIIHIDMDAFYASVEQRNYPELKGRPVVVGGSPQSRSVVCSASYEARRFGVRSAMSCAQAFRLCPKAIFIPPHFEKYKKASQTIRAIFESVTYLVEPLALDEAYLDVTKNHLAEPLAKNIALFIKQKIFTELGITASAGVGPNKFIAKLASDFKKPDGLVVVPPEKVFTFIEKLPVEKFWGVGPRTAQKLHEARITNAEDIRKSSALALQKIIGSQGSFLFSLAHGEDTRAVDPSFDPKSRGSETTFAQDILNLKQLLESLETLAEEVAISLKKLARPGRVVTVKIKYADFKSITRSKTLFAPTDNSSQIYQTAKDLLTKNTEAGGKPIRLLGISVGNLLRPNDPLQLCLDFNNTELFITEPQDFDLQGY